MSDYMVDDRAAIAEIVAEFEFINAGVVELEEKADSIRVRLFKLKERKAHIVMGFASFEALCKAHLKMPHTKSYIYKMLSAGRVENDIKTLETTQTEVKLVDETPKQVDARYPLDTSSSKDSEKPVKPKDIPTATLNRAKSLPTVDAQRDYVEREQAAVATKKFNTKHSAGSTREDQARALREMALERPAQPTPVISHSAPQVVRQAVLARPMPKIDDGEPVEVDATDITDEGKFVRISFEWQDGTPGYIRVAKRKLPGETTEHRGRDEYAQ